MRSTCLLALSVSVAVFAAAPRARAQAEPAGDRPDEVQAPRASRDEVPITAYTYSAAGVDARTIGVEGYFVGLAGAGQGVPAGGVAVYGSPIDRLTLVGDASRSVENGQFAPSFAAIVRLFGQNGRGFSLGALAKYKVEGFAVGADGEFEHEVEGGLLAAYAAAGWHLDVNAITGFGLTNAHEIDVEGRLRLGRDLGRSVRVGLDGEVRGRTNGEEKLPGDRVWDFAAGPQVLLSWNHFFGAITAGPATQGITSPTGLGFMAVATIGGTTL